MNLLITGAWQNAKENIDSIEKMGHTVVCMKKTNYLAIIYG